MNADPLALIIEDDEDLSFIFTEAMRSAGFRAEAARDGQLALDMLAQEAPEVVVLDLHLPSVAGTDILKQIRRDNQLRRTRVVIVTADARMAEEADAQADFVLIKPISFTLLRDLAARLYQE